MTHHIDITNIVVGVVITLVGAYKYVTHRNHPERARIVSQRTFLRLCIVMMACGIFVVLVQFIFPE